MNSQEEQEFSEFLQELGKEEVLRNYNRYGRKSNRSYSFTIFGGINTEDKIIDVEESNLSDSQKQLLLGTLHREYKSLPIELQERFKTWINE